MPLDSVSVHTVQGGVGLLCCQGSLQAHACLPKLPGLFQQICSQAWQYPVWPHHCMVFFLAKCRNLGLFLSNLIRFLSAYSFSISGYLWSAFLSFSMSVTPPSLCFSSADLKNLLLLCVLQVIDKDRPDPFTLKM